MSRHKCHKLPDLESVYHALKGISIKRTVVGSRVLQDGKRWYTADYYDSKGDLAASVANDWQGMYILHVWR
ncbi:MAG TPA: hypothetical protein VMY98_10215 [Anaerolineae bacterium]|nr:hypothetical protein [Anaerolineae bacterium]